MLSRYFDTPLALTLAFVNGVIVFYINWPDFSGALISGSVQIVMSLIIPGFTMPYVRRQVINPRALAAHVQGLIIAPAIVVVVVGAIHWLIATPEWLVTVALMGVLGGSALMIYFLLARHTGLIPSWF